MGQAVPERLRLLVRSPHDRARVGFQSQLFNLAEEPDEVHDLAQHPVHRRVREALHAGLPKVVDPEEIDRRAKQNQTIQGIARAYLGN